MKRGPSSNFDVPSFFTSFSVARSGTPDVRKFHEDVQEMVRKHLNEDSIWGMSGPYVLPSELWREEIPRACATAHVLIALLNDRYMTSTWSAREWWIFDERIRRARYGEDRARSRLLPVVWQPMEKDIPAVIRDRQRTDWYLFADPKAEGVFGLMHGEEDEKLYEKACYRIAALVADAIQGKSGHLPPLPMEDALSPATAWDTTPKQLGEWKAPEEMGSPEHWEALDSTEKVVLVLAGAVRLPRRREWGEFLARLSRLRGGLMLTPGVWPVTDPLENGYQSLVRHLEQRHGRKQACCFLEEALAPLTAKGAEAIAQITHDRSPMTPRTE